MKVGLDDPKGEDAIKACRKPVEEQWALAEKTDQKIRDQKATVLGPALVASEKLYRDW